MAQPISSGKPESGWEPSESRSIKTTIKYIVDVLIADDGVGGADPRRGAVLMGLKDRVEALGGTIRLVSPRGGGTSRLSMLRGREINSALIPIRTGSIAINTDRTKTALGIATSWQRQVRYIC